MNLHIQIEKFEGPLALLLYLIRKDEMDIFDINIHHITQQYLEYIKEMKKLDLEMAGDFVAMAATLIHIKSRMLLPQYGENGEELEVDDPRKVLVQKLLEYEKFQGISKDLYNRPLVNRDVYLRGLREDIKSDQEEEILVEENPLFSLIRAYRMIIKNVKNSVHKVLGEMQSIADRVKEIKHRLIVGQTIVFKDLLDKIENNTNQVLITFLSFLELCKLGYVTLYQAEPLSDIYIQTKKTIDETAIANNDAYSYVTETNILENKGAELQLDLNADDFSAEPEEAQLEPGPSVVEAALESEGDELTAGEGVQKIISMKEEDIPFIIEAATDEEILAEEEKLNLIPLKDQEGEV